MKKRYKKIIEVLFLDHDSFFKDFFLPSNRDSDAEISFKIFTLTFSPIYIPLLLPGTLMYIILYTLIGD